MDVTFGMMLSQVAGLFVLLLIGYWLNRGRKLPKEAESVLAQLSTKLFLPALLLHTFLNECSMENLKKYGIWVLYGLIFQVAVIFLAMLISKFLAGGQHYVEKVMRYAIAFPNTGGFGTPIVLGLFGSQVFFQYQLFLLPTSVFCYSWGVAQLMPQVHYGSWRKRLANFCNPVFLSTILGMILGVLGVKAYLPQLISTTLQNLSGCYSVVSLLLTGFVIGDYRIKDVIGNKMIYLFSALRLLVIPGVVLVILQMLQVPEVLLVLACLTFACPCGMNTVVYPAAYSEDTAPGVGMVLVTSALAVITIPIMFAFI